MGGFSFRFRFWPYQFVVIRYFYCNLDRKNINMEFRTVYYPRVIVNKSLIYLMKESVPRIRYNIFLTYTVNINHLWVENDNVKKTLTSLGVRFWVIDSCNLFNEVERPSIKETHISPPLLKHTTISFFMAFPSGIMSRLFTEIMVIWRRLWL